jgi:type II secretory pathway pseudopilin PulG
MQELCIQSSAVSLRNATRLRTGGRSHFGIARGFTYLGVLFLTVFMGLALTAVAHVWHVAVQRDKEAELLFIGAQFRNAIQRYSEISPGNASKQEFPKTLEDLVEDKRFGSFTMRHLRKIYVDPMTGNPDWELVVLPGIGIVGVHSKSDATPIKSFGFAAEFDKFSEAKNYKEWVFSPAGAPTTAAPAGTTGIPTGPTIGGTNAAAIPGMGTASTSPTDPTAGKPAPSAPGVATTSDDTQAKRQARERFCQNQRRGDVATCDAAAQAQGPAVGSRCSASIDPRYQACLDSNGQGIIPLDVSSN